jgi:hypothetical protein
MTYRDNIGTILSEMIGPVYRDCLLDPLRLALLALWVTGLASVARWPLEHTPDLAWAACALLATLITTAVIGGWRTAWLTPLALLIGLAAIAIMPWTASGWQTPERIAALTLVYALAAWHLGTALLRRPAIGRLAQLLDWTGGWGARGGRARIESTLHRTALGLSLAAVGMAAVLPPFGVLPLPVWIAATLFWVLAGLRYGSPGYAGLVLSMLTWGLLGAYADLRGDTLTERMSAGLDGRDVWPGLLLAATGLSFHIAYRVVFHNRLNESRASIDSYALPLNLAAVVLAGLALSCVPGLAGLHGGPMASSWTAAISILGLAGATLAGAGVALGSESATTLGVAMATLGLGWAAAAPRLSSPPWQELWPHAGGQPWLGWSAVAVSLGFLGARLRSRDPCPEILASATGRVAQAAWLIILAAVLPWLLGAGPVEPGLDLVGEGAPGAGYLLVPAVLLPVLLPLGPSACPLWPRSDGACGLVAGSLTTLLVWAWAGIFAGEAGAAAPWILIGGAYSLWLTARLVLPALGVRWGSWAAHWPWLGLGLMGTALLAAGPSQWWSWPMALASAGYLAVLIRHGTGFAWAAGLVLSWAGIAFSLAGPLSGESQGPVGLQAMAGWAVKTLAWANLLLLAAELWRRYGGELSRRPAWPSVEETVRPLQFAAALIATLWLALLCALDARLALDGGGPGMGLLPWLGALVGLSFLHLWSAWRSQPPAHALMLALLAAWWPLALTRLGWGPGPTLAAWAMGLLAARRFGPASRTPVLDPWLGVLPWAALAGLGAGLIGFLSGLAAEDVPLLRISIPETIASLTLIGLTWLCVGVQRRQPTRLSLGVWAMVGLAHAICASAESTAHPGGILAWSALGSAILALLLDRWPRVRQPEAGGTSLAALFAGTARKTAPRVTALAIVEWGLFLAYALSQSTFHDPSSHLPEELAALASAAITTLIVIGRVRATGKAMHIYAAAALTAGTLILARVLWVGTAPLTVWDTGAIMAAAYGVLALQGFARSGPLLRLALLLPLLALATVPLQTGSAHTALALTAAGGVYLGIRRLTRGTLPLLLGALALNAGVYLWLWDWGAGTGLFQVYLIPAALSVLLLLHLHRRELKPSVLYGSRLAALSVLYAAAGLDIFLTPGLDVLALALALALGGIVLGIGLRIRAFLYSGMAFLVLIVLGQIVELYPEQRLQRALLLLGLGTLITAAMVGFNLKREAILVRVRAFRADLDTWE